MYIYTRNVIISSDDGLSPDHRQAIEPPPPMFTNQDIVISSLKP